MLVVGVLVLRGRVIAFLRLSLGCSRPAADAAPPTRLSLLQLILDLRPHPGAYAATPDLCVCARACNTANVAAAEAMNATMRRDATAESFETQKRRVEIVGARRAAAAGRAKIGACSWRPRGRAAHSYIVAPVATSASVTADSSGGNARRRYCIAVAN